MKVSKHRFSECVKVDVHNCLSVCLIVDVCVCVRVCVCVCEDVSIFVCAFHVFCACVNVYVHL